MLILFIVVFFIGSVTSSVIYAHIIAAQMGRLEFQLCCNSAVTEMNGSTEVPVKLQVAGNSSRYAHNMLFIPSKPCLDSNINECVPDLSNIIFITPPVDLWKQVTDPWTAAWSIRRTNLGIYVRNWLSFLKVASSIPSIFPNCLTGIDAPKMLYNENSVNEHLVAGLRTASLNEQTQIYSTNGDLIVKLKVTSGKTKYNINEISKEVYFIHLQQYPPITIVNNKR